MLNIRDIDTVGLNEEKDAVRIIDQTLLPGRIVLEDLKKKEEMYRAIKRLEVRGAPAIGVFAALSMAVLSKCGPAGGKDFHTWFHETANYLNESRPTAVNLSWALKRMTAFVDKEPGASRDDLLPGLMTLAERIRDQDIEVCKRIGEEGLALIHPGDGVLTHCNAGKLATVRYGTATAPIYLAEEKGYGLHVFCDETRPLLQGARLTSFELKSSGVDTTLICDDMAGRVMKNGWIKAVFVGCDRVAANGDTANKIGTSMVAVLARYYGIPFYVCAPTSTIDLSTAEGDDIVVEERKPEEVTDLWYAHRMGPKGVKVYNPAFDVTDHDLISGFVTEYGVIRPPYREAFLKLRELKEKEEKEA